MKKLLLISVISFLFITAQAQVPKTVNVSKARIFFKFLTATPTAKMKAVKRTNVLALSKNINIPTAGTLNSLLTSTEKTGITDLILTGNIDARDFKILRDSMINLLTLDISAVNIAAYSGSAGTFDVNTTYSANEIPSYAFYTRSENPGDVKNTMTSIILPVSAISIGELSFAFCGSLTSVFISASITNIGYIAFAGGIAKINVDAANPKYSSKDGVLFNKAQSTIIQCPSSVSGDYTVPSTVDSIGSYAFIFCDKLSSVNLSSSVLSIGEYAFTSCSGLINVDAANTHYTSNEGVLLNKSKTMLIQCPTTKTGSYVIPSTVDSIGDNSFYNCNLLTSVSIPSSVVFIGNYAFYNCSGLTSITTNRSPVSISSSYNVFDGVNLNACNLNVPYGAKGLYQSASGWNSFVNIVENPHGLILGTNNLILSSLSGSLGNVKITTNDAWTASTDQSWLQISPQIGLGNDTIICTAEANTSTNNRVAMVTVSAIGIQPQSIQVTQTGLPKALNITPGGLAASMTSSELATTLNLKLTGTVDARDFKTMRDNMPKLCYLDISEASITAYNGSAGPASWITAYPANKIPDYAFNVGMSSQQYTLASAKLPPSITAIGDYAFYSCEALTDIVIPNSVTYIGIGGFGSCYNLVNVTLPDNLTSIESQAFTGCGFADITIPTTVKSIGYYGFSSCRNLRSVNIPNSVTTIVNSAFENCIALTDLTIGSSVASIGNSAFSGCSSLASVIIPNSVITLDGNAFGSCTNLTSVTLSNSLKIISSGCFNNCTKLTNVNIPNLVTKIDYSAFNYCKSLTSIIIPNSVTSINSSAFGYCSGLTSITVNTDIPIDLSSTYGVFTGVDNTTCILNVPFGAKTAYSAAIQWKDFSTIIENIHGFRLSTDSVKLPAIEGSKATIGISSKDPWATLSNQTWLKVTPDAGIGNDTLRLTADANISSLQRTAVVTVTSGGTSKAITVIQAASPKIVNITTAGWLVTTLTTAELSSITDLTITGVINAFDFKTLRDYMPKLENLDISNANIVTYSGSNGTVNYSYTYPPNEIPPNAFFNSSTYAGKTTLNTITLPASLTSIGSSAFQYCSGIIGISIPNSVTSIGGSAFVQCFGLSDIKISTSLKSIASNSFQFCSGLSNIVIPNSVKSISDYAFQYCSGLTGLIIPDSVSSLGSYAFANCTKLKNVTLGKSLTSINYGDFQNCTSLTNVIMMNSLKTIGDNSFGYTALINLIIPESVTSIGYSSFGNCTGLTEVVLPNSLTTINNDAFNYCTGLKKITLGNAVKTIKGEVFYGCTNLATIIIPETVTSIGSNTFSNCTGLMSITVNPLIPVDLSNTQTVFKGVDKTQCILNIPYQTKSLYSTSDQWKDFTNIVENPFELELESNKVKLLATEGSNTSIKVFSNTDWTATSDNSWLSVDPQIDSRNNSVTLTAHANFSILIRTATVTVSAAGVPSKTITVTQAATAKIANNIAGGLSSSLTTDELSTISNLVVSGTIDARDFKTMRDAMPLLSILNISNTTIIAYTGTEGTQDSYSYTYPANEIPRNAFFNPSSYLGKASLNSVILPPTITSLGNDAFESCIGLDSIAIPDLVKELTWNVFTSCKGLKKATIGKSVLKIDDGAFANCTSLSELIIPNSVTLIGFQAFDGCSSLTNVSIPNSVTSLGYESFSGCIALTDMIIPNSVKIIDYEAFTGCINFKKVTIPNSVITIGGNAFGGCTSLTDVLIGNSVTLIDFDAFYNCFSLTNVNIPNSVITIRNGAFELCSSLKNITIGNSVINIGSQAFNGCTGLRAVSIPASVKEIDWSAFYSCTALTSIYAYPTKPVDLSSNSMSTNIFYNVNKTTCILYVPTGSKGLYQAAVQWKDFSNIIEMTTSISDEQASIIKIYPNPVAARFRIMGLDEKAVLSIVDMNGKVLLYKQITGNEAVSIEELPKGVYIARIVTSRGTVERKLIKE